LEKNVKAIPYKSLIAAVIAGSLTTPAMAGSSVAAGGEAKKADPKPLVTIYGILDVGVEHLSNVGSEKKSVTRVPGITATLPSRLGFRLHKDVKPGLALVGTLEAGIQMDDGNSRQGGRLFGRQLYAGLKTNVGTFGIGRQYSMILGAMFGVDQLGPNIYSMGSLDGYLPNSRYDNSVTWKHKFGNFKTGLAYSFGHDTTGATPLSGTCGGEETNSTDTNECRAWSAMLRYDAGDFGVAGAIDRIKGGTGATAYFFQGGPSMQIDLSSSGDKDTRTTLGGYYKFGATKLSLGTLKRKVESAVDGNVESDIVYATASYKISPTVKIDGGVYKVTNDDHDADATLAAVRGFYTLDKGLDLYAQVGRISNSDNASYALSPGAKTAPPAGESQIGTMIGMRYIF
jgi:predicted porin